MTSTSSPQISRRVFSALLGSGGAAFAGASASAAPASPAGSSHQNPVLGAGGHIHHIGLWSKDFDKSVRFYCDGLGFRQVFSAEQAPWRVTFLDSGAGLCIELFENLGLDVKRSDPSWLPLTNHPLEEWPGYLAGRGALFHFGLRTDDVDAVFARAVAHGALPVTPPMDNALHSTQGEGALNNRWCYVEGPSGEWIELIKIGPIPPRA